MLSAFQPAFRHFRKTPLGGCISRRFSSFGVVFDIDGVLVRGRQVLAGAEESVHRLRDARVPFAFMTNGGGDFEYKRRRRLEEQLRLSEGSIHEDTHLILAHTPMRELVGIHGDERVLVLGCRNEKAVAARYGFRKVVSPQQLAAQHDGLYPFIPRPEMEEDPHRDEPIGAILIMHDPIDWALEIQVCCDVLMDRIPGIMHAKNVPVYNSNEDFVFAGAFPHPRHAQGTFLACLSHIYSMHSGEQLDVVRFGKPNAVTYRYTERLLMRQQRELHQTDAPFEKIFMIGDNPAADIRGNSA